MRAAVPIRLAEGLWILGPFAVFLAVLARLWFDAPIWDDYDAILGFLLRSDDATSAREWMALVFELHNEHRIAVTRLVTYVLARAFGVIDFRVLMLIGNLTLLGTFLFVWREFREAVPPAFIGAAAILTFQWSYWEASLMGSAGLPHLGVLFFAFGCLFFAMRAGAAAGVLAAVLGSLAAASQANGLLALPLAAAGCLLWGARRRALLLAVLAAAAWLLYFQAYARPPGHPSPLAAFSMPIATLHLFLVIVGGILPGAVAPAILGAAMLAGFAWLASRRIWERHPAAVLWILFLLGSAAAAAIGRVGLGVVQQSRYALGSTCLLVLLALCIARETGRFDRRLAVAAIAMSAALAWAASYAVWPQVMERTHRGKLLREAVAAVPGVPFDRYGGIYYPVPERAHDILERAGRRGYYRPREYRVEPWTVARGEVGGALHPAGGHVDTIAVSGRRVTIAGWSHLAASRAGRTLRIAAPEPFTAAEPVAIGSRPDVAFHFRDLEAVFAGFRVALDFATEDAARRAAAGVCLAAEAPGQPARTLVGGRC